MRRIAIVLALAVLGVPAGADTDEGRKAWWAYSEPQVEPVRAEPDTTWWSGSESVLVLSGNPEQPAPAAAPLEPSAEGVPVTRIVLAPKVPETRIVLYPPEEGGLAAAPAALHAAPEGLSAPAEEPASAPADTGTQQPEAQPEGEAAPADGSAQPQPAVQAREDRDNECHRYRRQIPRYEAELDHARDRDIPLAEQALEAQIERLEARRNARCPEDAPPDYAAIAMDALKTAAKVAAKAAIKAYTWGAF